MKVIPIDTKVKTILTMICLIISVGIVSAQETTEYPEVGKRMPDFNLNEVRYYSKKRVSLADFKGQWLILDCWGAHCGSCIEALPKTDSLQRLFLKQVKFLLIGYTGSQYVKKSDDKLIRKIFERNRREEKLNLSIAYDSLFFHRFDIWTTPYILAIDPSGIVRAITYKLTGDNINDLLAGKQPLLPPVYRGTVRKKMIKEKYGKQD